MFCRNCGVQIPDNSKFCKFCGADQTSHVTQTATNQVPNSKNLKPKNKKSFFLKTIIAIILVVSTIILISVLSSGSNRIKLGKTYDEVITNIPASGGILKIDSEDSLINGFTITVENGTYDQEKIFDIKTTEIIEHNVGDNFNPITPLITVDNGHDFAKRPMKVTIPIDITEDEFAMGFYYNKKSGELEALPFESYGPKYIILITNHFSDIVVSKISISELEKLVTSGSVSVNTGFEPGRDDWQFTNYGSALAPGGHCAGQSLTMAWYYYEKHLNESEPKLYSRFDNNGGIKTADFWEDDSYSYRFASVIQDTINWDSQEFHKYLSFSSDNQKRVFYAFAYAMQITKRPQFMGIYSFDSRGQRTGGHAIVAYKVENGRIYVADPNYPGQKDRYCELGAKSFKPYSSGANAADIDANGAVLYTEMHFIASSALINFSTIAENYEKMLVGSIGDNEFPRSSFQVMTKYDEDITKVVWSNVNKNKVVLTKEYYDLLPSDMKNLALVRVTPQAPDLVYSLYLNNNTSPEQNPVYIILEENIYYEISLNEGENNIAFLVEQINNGHYSYVDFVRINIDCSDEKAESETKVVTTQKPKSSKAVKIVCAFSDNYKYNPDIVTKECKAGDSFPYDYIDALKPPISGHKFGGYFTDPSFEKPLSYTTVPNEDVYVYILWTKMSLSEMLGKYEDAKPQDYLDYNYYEFIADGTVKHVYKYKDKTDIYTSKGTWTYRETPYQDYSISSLDVKMETSSFPLQFVVYEDRVREGGGKEYFRK